MKILWDEEKNKKLIIERGISFDIFADLILRNMDIEILDNPSREGQMIFVIPYKRYTYVVPFVIDDERNIILKTAYPSRKYHKRSGGKDEKDKT